MHRLGVVASSASSKPDGDGRADTPGAGEHAPGAREHAPGAREHAPGARREPREHAPGARREHREHRERRSRKHGPEHRARWSPARQGWPVARAAGAVGRSQGRRSPGPPVAEVRRSPRPAGHQTPAGRRARRSPGPAVRQGPPFARAVVTLPPAARAAVRQAAIRQALRSSSSPVTRAASRQIAA